MAARTLEAMAVALLLVGCATLPPPSDAGPSDAGPLALTLGTGEHAFTAVAPDETLHLAHGCQGLQHVWIALRATGIAPRGVHVHLWLSRVSDGNPVSAEFDTAITFIPDASGAYDDLTGLMLVIPTPDLGLAMPLTLHGEITDREGRMTAASIGVTLDWGTEICGV